MCLVPHRSQATSPSPPKQGYPPPPNRALAASPMGFGDLSVTPHPLDFGPPREKIERAAYYSGTPRRAFGVPPRGHATPPPGGVASDSTRHLPTEPRA